MDVNRLNAYIRTLKSAKFAVNALRTITNIIILYFQEYYYIKLSLVKSYKLCIFSIFIRCVRANIRLLGSVISEIYRSGNNLFTKVVLIPS